MSKILVTGGSGFVGSHVVAKLLNEGHQVRTTIRSTHREAEVRRMVRNGGVASDQALSFSQADLTEDHGWAAAAAGCDYVLHVASPFPQHAPENEDELIVPARDGTLRILRAARDAGAKRVVLTSSFAAIGYGHTRYDKVFDEEDWTDPNGPDVQPYMKSKDDCGAGGVGLHRPRGRLARDVGRQSGGDLRPGAGAGHLRFDRVRQTASRRRSAVAWLQFRDGRRARPCGPRHPCHDGGGRQRPAFHRCERRCRHAI